MRYVAVYQSIANGSYSSKLIEGDDLEKVKEEFSSHKTTQKVGELFEEDCFKARWFTQLETGEFIHTIKVLGDEDPSTKSLEVLIQDILSKVSRKELVPIQYVDYFINKDVKK